MTPIKLNYPALRAGDCFLTHCNKLVGRIIRLAETGAQNPRDDSTPTHGGLIIGLQGQLLAAEMQPRLCMNSLEKYTGSREQIVEVWRPYAFDDLEMRTRAEEEIAETIRRNMENTHYDLPGAILSSPLGRAVFGGCSWAKNNPARQFCTEFVCGLYHKYGDPHIPLALNPYDLGQYFRTRAGTGYRRVFEFKLSEKG